MRALTTVLLGLSLLVFAPGCSGDDGSTGTVGSNNPITNPVGDASGNVGDTGASSTTDTITNSGGADSVAPDPNTSTEDAGPSNPDHSHDGMVEQPPAPDAAQPTDAGGNTCIPDCAGKQCGPDGCGGSCGAECPFGQSCNAAGQCEGTGAPTGGTANCSDTYDCVVACGTDQACGEGCLANATVEAQGQLMTMIGCQQDNQCVDTLCVAENCAGETAGCLFDASGSGTCAALMTCLNGCGQTDMACQDNCIATASPEGQAQFLAINLCLQGACPTQAQTCFETELGAGGACSGYWSACGLQ